MAHDIRFALRMMLAHRWFSAAVVATLALGIGLNTMVFTLINAALFKPFPVPGGERLVTIRGRNLVQEDRGMGLSYPDFRDYRANASYFAAMEAGTQDHAVVSEQAHPAQEFSMERVSSGMFDMLQVHPILGRGFTPADDQRGAQPVVLLGYGVWADRYSKSPDVLGRQVRVNEKPATIIGVMPQAFKFPHNQDLWMALVPTPDLEKRAERPLDVFGKIKPGSGMTQAAAQLDTIAGRLAKAYPEADKGVGVLVQTFHQRYNGGPIRMVFIFMLAAVGCVLLIACANVANMLLSRALGRQREISIRVAMGASRWQVVRQLLVETLLISVLGGVCGLALSTWGVHWFGLATENVGKPYWVQFTMDYTVFGYFAAICLLSGLLFGLAPALRSSRLDLNSALKDGTRTAGTLHGGWLSSVLVVLQFALALVLLTGAGVFVRNVLANLRLNPWLPAGQILTARLRLPEERYKGTDSRQRFFDQLLPKLSALPGVTHAAMVSELPEIWAPSRHIEIEGTPLADPTRGPSASFLSQSPGYFAAINLPLLAGRDFDNTDGTPGRRSAIVTKEFAERFWPHATALGKRFRFHENNKPGDWLAVVGVSANMVQEAGEKAPNPLLFLPYRQEGWDAMALVIRSTRNPSSSASAVRAVVQGLDQDLPLAEVRTLTETVEHSQWYLRVFGKLFGVFALIALVIAAVGLYAVIAQATNSRTREIGVRMALGATAGNILGLILRRGARQLIAGLAFGLAAAFPVARLMSALPFSVSTSDPMVLITVSLLLTAVGLFACWLPARRAAALNPVSAIRYE